MIDLDTLKASGANSSAESSRLLAVHRRREAHELHAQLWAKWLRDHPGASQADILAFASRALMEVGL